MAKRTEFTEDELARAAAARNAYKREYYKRNKARKQAADIRYWLRVADDQEQKEGAADAE